MRKKSVNEIKFKTSKLKADILVKVGGSLLNNYEKSAAATKVLEQISKEGYRIAVVTGGGGIAETVRSIYARHRLSDSAAHRMAICAMDINSHYFASMNPILKTASSIEEAGNLLEDGAVPVICCYTALTDSHDIPETWDVTSDSLAYYLAGILNASKCILIKCIDGLTRGDGSLINKIACENIEEEHFRDIDRHLPFLMNSFGLPVYLINGNHPERLMAAVKAGRMEGTVIVP